MSSQHQPLPASWVDRLFARFSAAWGFQKTGVMFPVESHEAVRALWAEQLGRFQPESIRAALQAEIDSGREWPPTLPEFLHLCIQAQRVVPKEPYLRIEGKGKYDPNRPDIVEARERCMATANALGMRKLLDGVPE